MAMQRRRQQLPTGAADAIPYDQTGLSAGDVPQAADPQGLGGLGAPAGPDLGMLGQDPSMQDPSMQDPSMGAPADPAAMGPDLASLDQVPQDMGSPEDMQVQAMAAALDDPNTPPEEAAMLQEQLALAARRRLAGV